MKRRGLITLLGSLFITNTAAQTNLYPLARYDLIVERSPFSAEYDLGENIEKPDVESTVESKGYRLCAIVESEDGEANIGLQNLDNKKSFILYKGEEKDGFKLITTYIESREALVEHNGEQILYALKKDEYLIAEKARQEKEEAERQERFDEIREARDQGRRFGRGFRRERPQEQERTTVETNEVSRVNEKE